MRAPIGSRFPAAANARGTHGEIVFGKDAGQRPGQFHAPIVQGREMQAVAVIDQTEQRLQQMVAIGTPLPVPSS